jgi:hypothetical protein
MQNAFSSGPLHSSLPTIAAGEPVAGIVLGIVVFGDRIQITPGALAIEAGGIAALIVGVVMVARSSAFGGLQEVAEAIKEKSAAAAQDLAEHAESRPGRGAGTAGHPENRDDRKVPLEVVSRARRGNRVYRRPAHGPASGGDGG